MSDLSVVQFFSAPEVGDLKLSVVDDILGKCDADKTIRIQSDLIEAVRRKGAQGPIPMDFSEAVRFVMAMWAYGPEHFKSVLETQLVEVPTCVPTSAPQQSAHSAE